MKDPNLFVLTGGGTLGSVTPLLALAKELTASRPGLSLLWIGTKGGVEQGPVKEAGLSFRAISSGKLRRYLDWRNFSDPFRILKGFIEARRLLSAKRPAIVVSAGGFVAVPVVWAAASLRIPVHIHQMDIRPGLANRLSVRFASSVSVAYENSLADYVSYRPVWTGNPVREQLFGKSHQDGLGHFRLDGSRPTVLLLGGGTGAAGLNQLAIDSLENLAGRVNFIQVTGKGKGQAADAARKGLPYLDSWYRSPEFLNAEEMALAYAAADLVVTRAGMGTLTELAALGKPTVIIPMPHSHQKDNAELFKAAGAAEVWGEPALKPSDFANGLVSLASDREQLERLSLAIIKLNCLDAAERMASVILAGI